MTRSKPKGRARRKNPGWFGFIFAWLEEREVCTRDLDLLLPTHRNGWLRPQVEAKLATLDGANPVQADLRRRAEQAMALFEAVQSGAFSPPSNWPELEPWLARALAYFIKNGDAIPDHFEDGFDDDHREFVEMGERLGVLLDRFEDWRGRGKRTGRVARG